MYHIYIFLILQKIITAKCGVKLLLLCSWTAIEVINYFKQKGSEVFGCLLDYRKAFDVVNHVKMFKNLIKRGISNIIIRLFIFMYLFQKCYVKWDQTRSFSPKGGFSTYLDPLLELLRQSGHGCKIGMHFYGALAYCDDVILLATSIHDLQKMVDLC